MVIITPCENLLPFHLYFSTAPFHIPFISTTSAAPNVSATALSKPLPLYFSSLLMPRFLVLISHTCLPQFAFEDSSRVSGIFVFELPTRIPQCRLPNVRPHSPVLSSCQAPNPPYLYLDILLQALTQISSHVK